MDELAASARCVARVVGGRLVGPLVGICKTADEDREKVDARVDVDPRVDFFSIYVGGLTNAYRWTDTPAAYHVGDAPGRGRQFVHKMLQLNFWRAGDDLMPNEREFRYGVPLDKAYLYGVGDGVAYRWLYR